MAHINKLHYKENLKNVKSDVIAKGIFEDDKKHWTITSGQMKGKVGDLAFSFSKKEKTLCCDTTKRVDQIKIKK